LAPIESPKSSPPTSENTPQPHTQTQTPTPSPSSTLTAKPTPVKVAAAQEAPALPATPVSPNAAVAEATTTPQPDITVAPDDWISSAGSTVHNWLSTNSEDLIKMNYLKVGKSISSPGPMGLWNCAQAGSGASLLECSVESGQDETRISFFMAMSEGAKHQLGSHVLIFGRMTGAFSQVNVTTWGLQRVYELEPEFIQVCTEICHTMGELTDGQVLTVSDYATVERKFDQ
jgi:hypothetical protein